MRDDTRHFRNLNRDGLWPDFHWDGLELDAAGNLRLSPLPGANGVVPEAIAQLPSHCSPSGVAVDRNGTIYFADPQNNRILRINVCSGETEAVPCLGGEGGNPGQFHAPAGLLVSTFRHALFVADSKNGRIQIFDIDSLQLMDVWDGFEKPVSLAADSEGSVYVVDTGAHRVYKFRNSDEPVPSFWNNVAQSKYGSDPRAVAVDADRVYVLDGQTRDVCLFDTDGHLVSCFHTGIDQPTALAAADGAVYVGDAGRRRIAVFRNNQAGTMIKAGEAAGYEGPVAGLTIDWQGGLLVSPGCGQAPLRLTVGASFAQSGLLWSGAIRVGLLDHFWNRIHSSIDLPAGTHVEFFFVSGTTAPPMPVAGSADPFPAPWRPAGVDVMDFFIGGPETPKLWIGARFSNDVHASPVLGQLRLEFDQQGYLTHLPAIYRAPTCDDFLLRFLSLFESFFQEMETRIEGLPGLFDPASAPGEFLPWLAGFLALDLPESWSDAAKREAIAGAYASYARRGTAAGLQEALRVQAGVHAVVDEPIQAMGWWSMPAPAASCKPAAAGTWDDTESSILGFNTVLASVEPQGAVVGTTATLDRSHIIAEEEYGSKLFEAAAYQFTVQVYRGEVDCPAKLARVTEVVEREKPAHTVYRLCVIEPGLRIGYKARLGIDTVVGGSPTPTRLGESGLVLDGEPRGKLGVRSRVGVTTQL